MSSVDRVSQMKEVHKEALNLFKKKNKDYGDSFARYGPVGVIVRLGDKIERLSSITTTGIRMVNNESVRDTLIDLHNYSAMALMLMDEEQKERRNAFCENRKERSSSLPEFEMEQIMQMPPNFFPSTPPPGMLSFFQEHNDYSPDDINLFTPIDLNKKID